MEREVSCFFSVLGIISSPVTVLEICRVVNGRGYPYAAARGLPDHIR